MSTELHMADIVLDEIALEGLDGITLHTLWIRLSTREPSIPFSLDYNCKCYIWKNIILKNKQLEFFNLSSPRPKFIYKDRFQFVDPDTGVCIEQKPTGDCYPVSIVREDSSGLKGSCSTFNTRRNITANIRLHENELSHIDKKYGETFVVVASQKLRCKALYGKNNYETELYKIIFDDKIYSFLERIGRARQQGELTFGHGNINHAFKIKPANTFPLRKKLKKYHLITVQDFSLKQLGSSPNAAGKLLMLARFHKDHVPLYVNYLTNVSNLLSVCHQERLPLTQVKESLSFSEEVFRKILRLGSKYMKVEMRPYREFFPNAEPKEYLTKGKNAERGVKVLKLVAPYKGTMNDDEADEKVADDEDDVDIDCSSANGFGMFPEESTFLSHLDQSTLAHCHKVIDAYGTEGLKGKELGGRMHFSVFDMRLIWKSLEKRDCIDIVKVEEGKHRFRKLCLKKNSRPSCLPKLILPCKNSKLDKSFNASVSLCEVKDELELSQNISMDLLPLFDENTASLRNVTRANIIVDLVKNHKIISDMQVFKQRIFDEEGNKLFSTKSLRKILQLLVSNGKINKFEKSGLIESGERKFDFYCDRSVDEESVELQRALQYRLQKERTSLLASDAKAIQESTSSENIPILKFTSATHNKPKFAKAKVMHQFLWYLVYGSEDIRDESNASQLNENYIPAWQRHISPLPKLQDYPKGWCNISDVVDNMPLSIFLDVVLSISPDEVLGLEMYTRDPDRIHTRLHDIPVQIVCQLSNGRRYLFKFQVVCETLIKLGLLSFGKYDLVKKEEMFMYIHTEASLTNIPDRLLRTPLFADIGVDGRKTFHLGSFRDIHNYWLAFQTVSLDITAEPLTVKRYKSKELRMKFCDCLKGKAVNEIADDGRLPGDGLGPGGTDSTLFASLRRNWCQSNDGCIQVESFAFSGYTKKHPRIKKEKTLTIGSSVIKMKPKLVKVKTEKPIKKGPIPGTKQLKRRSSKSSKQKKKPSKELSEDSEEESNTVDHVTAEVGETALKAMRERLKRKRCYDEKDEEALKLMTRMRVSWSPEEDRVILLCILTNLFLANNFKWIVPSTAIREILHEKIQSSRTKTAIASLRRKNYLLKKEGVRKNILVYLSEALQNKGMCDEFRKGKKYNMSRIKENEAPFRSCLEKLERNFCQRESQSESILSLPNTTKEFHNKFNITDPYCHLSTPLKEVTTLRQVDFYTLQNVVHAFALLTDKIGRAHELYQLLSQFPQAVLSPVLKYMITVGIFTKLKRCDPRTDKIPPTSTGSYQLTQRYHYLFLVTYPKTIFKSTFDLYSSFPLRKCDPCHGSKYLPLADTSASAALMTTLMVIDMLRVETVTPAEIVVIQPTTSETQSPVKTKSTKKTDPRVDDDDDDDSDDNEFLDNIDSKASSTNSRTLLSWYRCQYAHSKSSKLMDLGNNLFINSCSVKIRLPSAYQTTTKASNYVSWMNSVHAMDKVRDWNACNTSLHPKTCTVLLKFLRTSFPEAVDAKDLMKQCIEVAGPSRSALVEALYEDISTSTFVGRTMEDLLTTFEKHSMETITYLLKILSALNLVVRVGVNNFRYVCFDHAKNWLVQAKKNLKGRGVFYKNRCQFSFNNFPIEKTLEKVECPQKDRGSCDDSNDEDQVDEGDVEVVLKYGNFNIKQKLLKKSSETTENREVPESNGEKSSVPLSPTHENVPKRTIQSSTTNSTPSKPKSKHVGSKRSCDSPVPRPAKKAKSFHEDTDVLEARESLNSRQGVSGGQSNETQIDFLIDQLSNSTHNESNYMELVQSRDPIDKPYYGSNKREGDPSICLPVKRQKSDEMLYTDFVQDPNFNFSSYLKESSSVLHNPNEFHSMGLPQMHSHHYVHDQLGNQMGLGMPFPPRHRSLTNADYPVFNNLNTGGDQGYMMPISGIAGKDIPMLLNGGGQGDGREMSMFGHMGKPLHQLDGATDVEDSTSDSDKCQDTPPVRFSDRLRNNLNKNTQSHSSGPSPKGTYKMVRTLPRPWKTPEGTINRAALSSMLESICLFLLEHPGISREVFLEKYQKVLQPVVLLEFIEILENLGVLKKTLLKKSHKPSLFSKRYTTIPTSEYRGMVTEVYFATPDCIIKMGQFLSQLHANKRTSDDADD